MSPAEGDHPPFAEPWQARAFALAVTLSERGVFTWSEWTRELGAEIARSRDDGPEDYWRAWVTALEHLLEERSEHPGSSLGATEAGPGLVAGA